MLDYLGERWDWLAQPIRPLARGLVHLGHAGTGYVVASLPVFVFGAPTWAGLFAVVAWTMVVETRDAYLYNGFSKDSAWDAYQLLGGGAIALLGGWASIGFLAVWLGVYLVCALEID